MRIETSRKLPAQWRNSIPKDGVDDRDIVIVLEHLEIAYKRNCLGHIQAFHSDLIQSVLFPYGSFSMRCHAHGKQGMAHPLGVKDLVRAADILAALPEHEKDEE